MSASYQVREGQPQSHGAAVRAAGRRQDVASGQARGLCHPDLLVRSSCSSRSTGSSSRRSRSAQIGERRAVLTFHSWTSSRHSMPGARNSPPIRSATSTPSAARSCCCGYNSFAFLLSPVVTIAADGTADLQGLSGLHQFARDQRRVDRRSASPSAAWRPMRWPASSTSRSSAISSSSCCWPCWSILATTYAGVHWAVTAAVALALFFLLARTLGKHFKASLGNGDILFWIISQRILPPVVVDHSRLHDVPGRRHARHASGAHPRLCRRQPAHRGVADA